MVLNDLWRDSEKFLAWPRNPSWPKKKDSLSPFCQIFESGSYWYFGYFHLGKQEGLLTLAEKMSTMCWMNSDYELGLVRSTTFQYPCIIEHKANYFILLTYKLFSKLIKITWIHWKSDWLYYIWSSNLYKNKRKI